MRSAAASTRALKATVNTVKALNRMQPQKPAALAPPEPSVAEVSEYAKWLGLEDPELFWIARQALSTQIPSPWIQCQTDEGDVFFHNTKTKESVWDHPFDAFYKAAIKRFNSGEIPKTELVKIINEKNPGLAGSARVATSRVSSTLAVNVDTPVKAKTVPSRKTTPPLTTTTTTFVAGPAASLSDSIALSEQLASGRTVTESEVAEESEQQSPIGNVATSVAESESVGLADSVNIPTTTVRIDLGSSTSGVSQQQVIQSERVGMENLRRELQETKSRLGNLLGDLKHERARSKEMEVQLSAARMAAIPATTELPALKAENSKLVEEVVSAKHRLEETAKTLDLTQSRLNTAEDRIALMKVETQKRRDQASKAANALIDEDRMTRLKFTAVEETNIAMREEILRLRRILSARVENSDVNANPKKGGCLGGLCGGKDAEAARRRSGELASLNAFQLPPQPTQPFVSRVPEIVAELRVALQPSPVASPQTGEEEGSGNLDLGNASDYEGQADYGSRNSGQRSANAVFTTASGRGSSKFAPPRRR